MKNLSQKVSVIIPAHNEEGRITQALEETIRTFKEFNCPYEIIVIDDGSSDQTYEEALKLSHHHQQILVKKNWENYGKGRAVKKGCRYASGEYIVFLDADMDLHPGQLQTFMDIMRLDDADVVIGSKRHPNSVLNYPLDRRLISTVYFWLIKLLFGLPIHDTQTGLKIFKAQVIRKVLPRILVKQFAYDLEILANAHRLGFKIAEAPVVLDSKRKLGRVGLRAIWQTTWDTLAVFYRMKILRYYDRISDRRQNGA
ncbi:MAG: glycosyltransferase [Candidatus Omnitrophota bacterium]